MMKPNTARLWHLQSKRWKLCAFNAENDEIGKAWIEKEPRGFHWYVERWIHDGKVRSRKQTEGVATTFRQARDRILVCFKIPLASLKYLEQSTNIELEAEDVEPKPKRIKLTSLKKDKWVWRMGAIVHSYVGELELARIERENPIGPVQ
jgi:hypothetical protein